MHEGLPRELAIKRMEDHERWCQEHREELEVSSQQLFDDMFGVDDNEHTEMLTAREQLMEDIQRIIESRIDEDCDGLIETLQDAVC